MKVLWEDSAWDQYLQWQNEDRKTLRRINSLIKDMMRSPFEWLGKPEALKGTLSGLWSRRIDAKHRIVYFVEQNTIHVIVCLGHYDDKIKAVSGMLTAFYKLVYCWI